MATFNRFSVRTVDSHIEGNATRAIAGGIASPPGEMRHEQVMWLREHHDGLRRLLNFEPTGSELMCSVLPSPWSKDVDFSAIIMEQDASVPPCSHCIIGTATTVVSQEMVEVVEPLTCVVFDTPAGVVVCEVKVIDGRVGAVTFENVESFVLEQQVPIDIDRIGKICVDFACGGDFYTIVDADEIGLDLSIHNDTRLTEAWTRVRQAVSDHVETVHPERKDINRCYPVLFASGQNLSHDYKQTIVVPPHAGSLALWHRYQRKTCPALRTRRGGLGGKQIFAGSARRLPSSTSDRFGDTARHHHDPVTRHAPRLHQGLSPFRARPGRPVSRRLPRRPAVHGIGVFRFA
jgi:proline racemase